MDILFNKVLALDIKHYSEYIVTPIAPYIICDHFISTEIVRWNPKYLPGIEHIQLKGNDLLKNKNYDTIKEGDIIQVQVDLFGFFMNDILPHINTKIILITAQNHLPQLKKSSITDDCLNNDKIILWISQNPIYHKNDRYLAFPYGLRAPTVNTYMNNIQNIVSENKTHSVYNSPITIHPHLTKDHIRRHPFFSSNTIHVPQLEYLSNIANSKFVISTAGDRGDCFRHYECIGLNAIPISNICNGYTEIFKTDMIYSNIDNMIDIVNDNIILGYHKPNRDILTIQYWINNINVRLSKLFKKKRVSNIID